jgi:hypothetical protein
VKSALAVAALLMLASLAFSAEVKDHTGTCTVTVPSDWTVAAAVGNAQSPDKKVSITVNSPTHGLNSLDQVKQMAPGIYKDDKVTKSGGSEFQMEGTNQAGKPNVYRAIPAGAKVCIAEIVYQSGSAGDAKAIIETLKTVK